MSAASQSSSTRRSPVDIGVTAAIFVAALAFAGFGTFVYGFWQSGGPGPGFFPTIFGLLGAVCAGVELVRGGFVAEAMAFRHLWPAVGMVIAVLLVPVLGMLVAMTLFAAVWIKGVERRSWLETVIACVSVVAFVHLVFATWLGVQFPMGLAESFL
ncbi:tripartite tricarboxylate transporter TctB family protein [Marinivivus vitaminiproducens]|uniref:tripartite tricarboxylate transporter TctB family protein n=1 Tax=Marinivivus vitaminiproducens TaxID=3035935 RepID=UPI002799C72C|nr:tripartite tricarboxylate transporter TctB family protein [Geminicoccaceae bacterium SCSIO 64248]